MTPGLVCSGLLSVVTAIGLATTPSVAPVRLLFVGNSLTQANNLPESVCSIANAAGQNATCETVAFGGFSLEDHWQQGDAVKAIAKGGWSIVILQQGPSALPESQTNLREFTKRFDGEIKKAGARTALFMVWPENSRKSALPAVSDSYRNAAKDVGGLLFPVGDAWTEAWKRDPAMPLYGEDQFHPSQAGSYLAALVIVQRVFGISPLKVASPAFLTPVRAQTLKEAALSTYAVPRQPQTASN